MSRSLLIAFASLLLAGPARLHGDDLVWEKSALEFHPSAADAEVKGEFRCENIGKKPITISAVKPECGCTTALLENTTLQPGEKGVVKTTFTIGQRKGRQEKHIRLEVAGREEPVVLTMVTFIPEQVRFTPNFVYWMAGEPPTPKTMSMTILPDAGAVTVTEASSSNSHLRVKVEPLTEGKEYRLIVEPADTATDATAVLNVITTPAGGGTPKTFQAYAQVKRPVH
jgi:hypothetical protein